MQLSNRVGAYRDKHEALSATSGVHTPDGRGNDRRLHRTPEICLLGLGLAPSRSVVPAYSPNIRHSFTASSIIPATKAIMSLTTFEICGPLKGRPGFLRGPKSLASKKVIEKERERESGENGERGERRERK